jgi:putative component of membrane protein insertase Oxa1/YidC/SpoIIIJ protein YidD
MTHSLEHFHTFLPYCSSYTISAVIFHSTVWAQSGFSLHFSQFSMNTQKGEGKEMKKLSSNMPISFSAIYA